MSKTVFELDVAGYISDGNKGLTVEGLKYQDKVWTMK